jgi:hypothetical protein
VEIKFRHVIDGSFVPEHLIGVVGIDQSAGVKELDVSQTRHGELLSGSTLRTEGSSPKVFHEAKSGNDSGAQKLQGYAGTLAAVKTPEIRQPMAHAPGRERPLEGRQRISC